MTPFAAELRRRLDQAPLRLDAWMAACNAHYYATRNPLGAAGDFTTAPEISQMFGELLGLWLAQVWADQGGPPFVLGEKGVQPAKRGGNLFLRIAPSPWNVNPTGSYTVKLSVD